MCTVLVDNFKMVCEMRKIKLTQGKYALVNNKDFEWLDKWKWYAAFCNKKDWHSVRGRTVGKERYIVYMHREIVGLKREDARIVDHRDHNGLNNQRYNIRICTPIENVQKRTVKKNNSSKYKGVHWAKHINKWIVRITHNKKRYHLGCFISELRAAKAYDKKAVELFGEFAYLNFRKKKG